MTGAGGDKCPNLSLCQKWHHNSNRGIFFAPPPLPNQWEWDYLLGVSQPDGFIGEGKWEEEEKEDEEEEEEATHAALSYTKQGGCRQCARLSHTHHVATSRSAAHSLSRCWVEPGFHLKTGEEAPLRTCSAGRATVVLRHWGGAGTGGGADNRTGGRQLLSRHERQTVEGLDTQFLFF